MATFVTGTRTRCSLFLGSALAAVVAFTTGCTNTYDTQPAVAYYVAPPPPPPTVVPATGPVTDPNAPALVPGQEVAVAQADYADTDPSALADFKEPLAPYGTWVNDPTYGTVWVPREDVVGADFVPYQTAGHWDYDDDYVWVSDYSWGWAPFHYGRWISAPNRGWVWIPGRTYSGAWVTWRTGGYGYGYVGWAPMAPSWYWFDGYAYGASVALWYSPHYAYCHHDHLFSRNVGSHVVRGRDANVHDAHTSPYNPAKPQADGRVAAKPSVNERTPASPAVDPKSPDSGRGASAAGGLGAPQAGVRGPAPKSLGIDESKIARVTPADSASLAKAHAFATPAAAVKAGGQAPTPVASSPRTTSERSTLTAAPGAMRPGLGMEPMGMGPRYAPAARTAAAPNQAITSAAAVRSQATAPTMPTQVPSAVGTGPRPTDPRLTQTAPAAQLAGPRLSSPSGIAPSEFAARAGTMQSAPSVVTRAPAYQGPSSVTPAARAPSYSTPSSSTFARSSNSVSPSRPSPSYSPSRPSPSYAPSRSSAPSYSPSRSVSPSPSRSSAPRSSSPSFASPSRSYSAPSRSSSPSRSFSSPSRSSGSTRSTGGGGRSFSSSRGRR